MTEMELVRAVGYAAGVAGMLIAVVTKEYGAGALVMAFACLLITTTKRDLP